MLDVLDRPIAYHRVFVTITNSVTAAVMLSQAVYWSKRTQSPDGWFYKTQADWTEETGLSRKEQETARRIMRDIGVLEERLNGVPARLYYRVNRDKLEELLSNLYAPNGQTSMPESDILECPKRANIHTENTIQRIQQRDTRSRATVCIDDLIGMGVDSEHARDWLAIRKSKNLPLTNTALKKIQSEADAAGITLADAIRIAASEGWAGFKASWGANTMGGKQNRAQSDTGGFVNEHTDTSWADGL